MARVARVASDADGSARFAGCHVVWRSGLHALAIRHVSYVRGRAARVLAREDSRGATGWILHRNGKHAPDGRLQCEDRERIQCEDAEAHGQVRHRGGVQPACSSRGLLQSQSAEVSPSVAGGGGAHGVGG